MNEQEPNPATPWHSPHRAWSPLMWIIGAVAFALSAMTLAPLLPLILAAH